LLVFLLVLRWTLSVVMVLQLSVAGHRLEHIFLFQRMIFDELVVHNLFLLDEIGGGELMFVLDVTSQSY
jgi:hypothetical protein